MAERVHAIPFPQRRVSVAKAKEILAELKIAYPNAVTALNYRSPFELLIAVALSAQTTDVMVNKVTPELFEYYPTPVELAQADIDHVDDIIRRIGFHRTKAKNIILTAQMLVEHHDRQVPRDRDALEKLAGVGRKTASVVLSVVFEEAAFAVDTHVFRVSQRLGLALGSTPLEIEQQVTRLLPPEEWRHAHHWLILHGREKCKAIGPKCESCPVAQLCPSKPIIDKIKAQSVASRRPTVVPPKAARKKGPGASTRDRR
jgi:endonuclease-3